MSELQAFFWFLNSAVIFFMAVPILLLVMWVVNKWILKGKIKLLYRILLSIAIPLALLGYDYYRINNSFYNTTYMNNRLECIGVEISLPSYEITSYKNESVIADDFKDTYQMEFKDANVKNMIPILDSLCNVNEKWIKKGEEYIYNNVDFDNEFNDSLIVRPSKGTATFVRYMW